jgi:hypothetical protein
MADLSIDSQGPRIRALYLREKQLRDSKKTQLLLDIPKPPVVKFMCQKRKETDKKMRVKIVQVTPPLDPANTEQINKIISYIERDFIAPILGEAMVLFKCELAKVMKGDCKVTGSAYRALIRFSYKLSMNLGDLYNIKGNFHETTDKALDAMLQKLNRIYYKPPKETVAVAETGAVAGAVAEAVAETVAEAVAETTVKFLGTDSCSDSSEVEDESRLIKFIGVALDSDDDVAELFGEMNVNSGDDSDRDETFFDF